VENYRLSLLACDAKRCRLRFLTDGKRPAASCLQTGCSPCVKACALLCPTSVGSLPACLDNPKGYAPELLSTGPRIGQAGSGGGPRKDKAWECEAPRKGHGRYRPRLLHRIRPDQDARRETPFCGHFLRLFTSPMPLDERPNPAAIAAPIDPEAPMGTVSAIAN